MPVSSQTPVPDETEVLSLAREGDVKAFSELVRRYESKIFRLAQHITQNREDAEDVLQDVFYELVNTYRLMKPVEQMASWMFTVARNKITDARYELRSCTTSNGKSRPLYFLKLW